MLKFDRVHHNSYLFSQEIDLSLLSDDKAEIFELKQDYEIISLSIEILETDTETIDVGLIDDTQYFLDNIATNNKEVFESKVKTTIKENDCLCIETKARNGKIKLRVFYFTPSTMYR